MKLLGAHAICQLVQLFKMLKTHPQIITYIQIHNVL